VLFNNKVFDVRDVIASVCQNNRCLLRLKHLTCSVHVDPSVPQRIKSDEFKVTQILLNYLSNAIKFCPSSGKIGIQCRADKEQIVIAVEDEGLECRRVNSIYSFSDSSSCPTAALRKERGSV
jgi:two-component system sensor histidine kinase VicK